MKVKKVLYTVLKQIKNKEAETVHDALGLSKNEFGNIIDMMLDEKLITNAIVVRAGAEDAVETIHLRFAKITIKGLYYLEENSKAAQTCKGIKQSKSYDLEKMQEKMPNIKFLALKCPHCTDAVGNFADIILYIPKKESTRIATECVCNGQVECCAISRTLMQTYNTEQLLKKLNS